jgi:hypothetical protein
MKTKHPESGARRSFVVRHERWITFSGALIVMATFISKDNVKEKWSSEAQEIGSALTEFSIRQDLLSTDQPADERLRRVTCDATKINGNDNGGCISLANFHEVWASMMLELRIDTRLLEASHDAALMNEAKQISVNLSDLGSRPDRMQGSQMTLDGQYVFVPRNARDQKAFTDELYKTFFHLWNLSPKVQESAEEAHKSTVRYARFSSWVVNIFFLCGWGLGLISKVADGAIELGSSD